MSKIFSQSNNNVYKIIVTGTPGVGKTSVSLRIAHILNAKYINLANLVKSNKLFLGYDSKLNSYIIDEERTKQIIKELLEKNGRIVIDTHILTVFEPKLIDLVIVLRLNPKILLNRLKERNYPLVKIKANIQAEVIGVCLVEALKLFGSNKVVELDVTSKRLEEVVQEVLDAIRHPHKYRPGKVDWSQIIYDDELIKYLI